MKNFVFNAYTEIIFGKGEINKLPTVLSRYGKNILLTYGGGSIKKNGIYQSIMEICKDFNIIELSGIEPNPKVTSVRKGAELCKEHKIDVILAVGGGSTIDCSKVIGAATFYDGDPWDLVLDKKKITKVLPIVTVLTLAATGSEMDGIAVISNMDTNDKLTTSSTLMKPLTSILDPEYLYSVPKIQTAAGTADIMSHIFEVYFSSVSGAFIQDKISEGILKTCIKYCPIALKDPENYEARANLMWSSSLAINGLTSCGKGGSWTCHAIEHELGAYYDITHGVGLAILTPSWMRYILNENTVDKFAEYAVNVWGMEQIVDKYALANMGIDATEAFFKSINLPMTLTEIGIDEMKFEIMAEKSVKNGKLASAYVPLTAEDVHEILEMCL